MRVEVLEKRDNEVVVKFQGVSPMDAMLLALVTIGPVQDNAGLGSNSYSGRSTVSFGSWSVPVIENMQPPKESK